MEGKENIVITDNVFEEYKRLLCSRWFFINLMDNNQ